MSEKLLLIGNGPSALAKKMGWQIDNYDGKVLRFNSYATDGFEEFVGSRTDFWWTMADFDAKIAEKIHESRLFVGPQKGVSLPDYYLQKNVFGLPYNLEDDSITKNVP